jgi:hypothetical protein
MDLRAPRPVLGLYSYFTAGSRAAQGHGHARIALPVFRPSGLSRGLRWDSSSLDWTLIAPAPRLVCSALGTRRQVGSGLEATVLGNVRRPRPLCLPGRHVTTSLRFPSRQCHAAANSRWRGGLCSVGSLSRSRPGPGPRGQRLLDSAGRPGQQHQPGKSRERLLCCRPSFVNASHPRDSEARTFAGLAAREPACGGAYRPGRCPRHPQRRLPCHPLPTRILHARSQSIFKTSIQKSCNL